MWQKWQCLLDFRINLHGQEVFGGTVDERQMMRMLSVHYPESQVSTELEVRRHPYSYVTTMGESNSQFHKRGNWSLFRLTLRGFSLFLKLIWAYGYNFESSCYELEFSYWFCYSVFLNLGVLIFFSGTVLVEGCEYYRISHSWVSFHVIVSAPPNVTPYPQSSILWLRVRATWKPINVLRCSRHWCAQGRVKCLNLDMNCLVRLSGL